MSREILIDAYRAALDAVDARRCVRASLTADPPPGAWHVVAIGKAAGAMAQGAVDALADRIAGGRIVLPPEHLPTGFAPDASGLVVLTASHPMPDARSLAAGEAIIDYVEALPPRAQVLFLVSGGASSLVEALRPGLSLDDLQRVNRWALTSGAPIADVNAVRRCLSRLKGGGLAQLAAPRRTLALMISDVPRDDPRVIGSGLLHAGRGGGRAQHWPEEIAAIVARASQAAASSRAPVPAVPVRMVATLREACLAAATTVQARGLEARIVPRRLTGDAAVAGRACATRLARSAPGVVLVWGGETTVTLPTRPGRGGRSQHLALAAAIALESRKRGRGAVLLAAGTDGIDGASGDAGAVVDAQTCLRGRDAGLDPHVSLDRADSGSFLEAAGDLLHTGATLTNVGDLVLGLEQPGGR